MPPGGAPEIMQVEGAADSGPYEGKSMPEVLETQDTYQADFERLKDRAGEAWAWFEPARERAFDRFRELGFPHKKMEEWRFTNVQPIAETPFALPEPGVATVAPDVVHRFGFPNLAGPKLVFVDGRLSDELSDVGDLPRGVRVMGLGEAVRAEPQVVQAHLGHHADSDEEAFTALNTAFAEDGVFVHVARNVQAVEPIHALFLSTAGEVGGAGERPRVTHPRNLIIAEEGAEATVIEHYVAAEDGVYLSNTVTELAAAANARLHHYVIEEESEQAYNISTLRAYQARDSQLESHTILFGGAIVRNNIHVVLDGENCDSLINGLYVPHHDQHMDNHMRVVHAKPHCDSRQFYKGVLNDKAGAVFTGRIHVVQDAQQTDAKQSNTNLLLSDDAHVDAKPQLEIHADDVKCTHGATMGEIDRDALFYLRARGIGEEAARGLLIYAFAHESLDRIKVAPIRTRTERMLMKRLPHSKLLESLFG